MHNQTFPTLPGYGCHNLYSLDDYPGSSSAKDSKLKKPESGPQRVKIPDVPRPIAFCTGATQGTCGVCMRVKPRRTSRPGFKQVDALFLFMSSNFPDVSNFRARLGARQRRFEPGTQSHEHGQGHRKYGCRHYCGIGLAFFFTKQSFVCDSFDRHVSLVPFLLEPLAPFPPCDFCMQVLYRGVRTLQLGLGFTGDVAS